MTPGARTGPLRVALLCHYPDDAAAPAGGPWAVGRNLAAGLVGAGVEVHVVTYRGGTNAGRLPKGPEAGGSLHVHPLRIATRRGVPRPVAAVPAIATAVQRIDPQVVTAHAPEYALGALQAGYPTAFTIHGVVRQEFRAFRSWRFRLPLLVSIWQDRLAALRVGHIFALNRYVVEQYRARTGAQFHLVDNPIDDLFFELPARQPEPRTLLLVGALSERKDPLTLLKALALVRRRLPDVQLRVAGPFRAQGFGRQLERFIRREGLQANVRFLGELDQAQLARAYGASALAVLSSRQETAPLVLLEAMACGRPVVATDVGGVGEIVTEGDSGYVVPAGDVGAMAARIEAVLTDPGLAASLGARGRELAGNRYRRQIVGRRYAGLLAGITQDPAVPN